jgi:hypothetical protein
MTTRDQQALFGGGIAVALAVILLRVGPWVWRTYTESRDELQARGEQLAWMRRQVAGARRLEDSGVVVRDAMARLAPRFLSGADATEAAADLNTRVTQAAERAHVGISRTDLVADSITAGAARRISLTATLESDTRGLFILLGLLAVGPQIAVVDEARISAEAPVDSTAPERLHTELIVRGWYLPSDRAR